MAAVDTSTAAGFRPLFAFFDYADTFEDFYPHYGVTQADFARHWHGSGNHTLIRLIVRSIADVVWYEFSIKPELSEARHEWSGCTVRIFATSWLHRLLWRVFYLSPLSWRLRPWYGHYALIASYSASLSLRFLRQLLRDRPSTLICQDYSNGRFDLLILLGWLLRMRVVAYHAGSTQQGYVGRALKRWTIRKADKLLASSVREAEMLEHEYRVPSERIDVVLTPIDTDAFCEIDRDEACAMAGLDGARRYVLFVGRLDERIKRVGLLIDCFARITQRLPDVTLLVVGEGADRAVLCAHAEQCPAGTVRFLGWRNGAAELAPLYSAANCLVLVSRSEGFPTVIGEAMACGAPVIATDVGGVRELVRPGENGWLLTAGSDEEVEEQLERALYEALQGGSESAARRQRARESAVAQLSFGVVADKLRGCLGNGDDCRH